MPKLMPDIHLLKLMHPTPKISIITPSYNQGQYIEQTIKSVISQNGFAIEYIIIDGGSTDATVEVIKQYENEITYWVSEKDEGQSQAINKGMTLATGDIVAWLNSDDMYLPDALAHAVAALDTAKPEVCFGNCIHFKEDQRAVEAWGSDVIHRATTSELENYDYIIQPSAFWTRKAWELAGPLREDLHYAFDWEWFLRAKAAGVVFHSIPHGMSMYRIHDAHKSGSGGNKRQQEIASIYKAYSPRYYKLYEMVRREEFSSNDFKSKVVRKLLNATGNPSTDIDLVRFFKKQQYAEYTTDEIRNCLSML